MIAAYGGKKIKQNMNFKEFGPSVQAAEQYKQKKKKKKLIIIFIILFVLTMILWGWALSLNYSLHRESKVDSLKIIDSLKSELFIEQINVQRYEIVIDRIKDEDSVLYEKIEKYLSETE